MKILLVNKFFYLKGGAETVFFQERQLLLEQGVDVIDFAMADKNNLPSRFSDYFVPNIDYHNQKSLQENFKNAFSFIHSSIAVKNIERLVLKERPEIAHLHNIYHQLTPSIIPMLKKHGIKIVMTLHDCKLICPSYLSLKEGLICDQCQGKYFWKPIFFNCQGARIKELLLSAEAIFHKLRRSYKGVDLFLTPSRFFASLIAQRIPREKIIVLPNGIDVYTYQPVYEDQGYGLYFGRLSKEKGVKTLLRAQQQMKTKLSFKIVGVGPLEEELRRDYPHVDFLGYQSGRALNDLIANSSFVVVPSEWYENCSMVILESMAFGKPVIGSRIGGIPEQIEDGKTGFLFEMGNIANLAEKMELLATKHNMRIAMGKAARAKLEQEYSLQSHCLDLLNIYKDLCHNIQ